MKASCRGQLQVKKMQPFCVLSETALFRFDRELCAVAHRVKSTVKPGLVRLAFDIFYGYP